MNIIDLLIKSPDLVNEIQRQYEENNWSGRYISDYNTFVVLGKTLNIRGYLLDTVKFKYGHVSLFETYRDVISFEFGGCVMAYFQWYNKTFAAHIHNAEASAWGCDQRYNWGDFVRKESVRALNMFQPGSDALEHLARVQPFGVCIWGVITADRSCYSIYTECQPKTDKLQLLSIKKHESYGLCTNNYNTLLNLTNRGYANVSGVWNSFWIQRRADFVYRG